MEKRSKVNCLTFAEKNAGMKLLEKMVKEEGFKPCKTWKSLAELVTARYGKTVTHRMVQEFADVAGIDRSLLVSRRSPIPSRQANKDRIAELESQVAELKEAVRRLSGDKQPGDKDETAEPDYWWLPKKSADKEK